MAYSEVAGHAFEEARKFYTGGKKRADWVGASEDKNPGPAKSVNKIVLDKDHAHIDTMIASADETGRDAVFELRRTIAGQAFLRSFEAEALGDSPIKYGEELIRLAVGAGNCGELASVAAFAAWEKLGRPTPVSDIAVASLAPPGDHGWAVIGPPAAVAALEGRTIASLKDTVHDAGPVYAVDAWTNLCCPMGKFHDLLHSRTQKWMTGGKRISWKGKAWRQNAEGDDVAAKKGWYPPVGDYFDCFVTSPITVRLGLARYT
ncbi:hypothetical protein [Elioraea sp.]|uniref:hypothetical protein n=1 Tax=Elioraea sp. TaxID=2185103 RepID=UPI0025C143C7|nr:hypothetical protein [Elioraea sp.]